MRPVREITADEENFRTEPISDDMPHMQVIRRDFVEPEPVGTIVLMAFRVAGYDADCDGSAMARLQHIDKDGEETGWYPAQLGLHPGCELVVSAAEWREMFERQER